MKIHHSENVQKKTVHIIAQNTFININNRFTQGQINLLVPQHKSVNIQQVLKKKVYHTDTHMRLLCHIKKIVHTNTKTNFMNQEEQIEFAVKQFYIFITLQLFIHFHSFLSFFFYFIVKISFKRSISTMCSTLDNRIYLSGSRISVNLTSAKYIE